MLFHIILALEVGIPKKAGKHEHKKEIAIRKAGLDTLVDTYHQKHKT